MAFNDKTMPDNAETRRGATRYGAALKLYGSTDMPVKAICELTGVGVSAFRAYVRRCHRDLMFARHGMKLTSEEARRTLLRNPRGQSEATRKKYKDAIAACDSEEYLAYNVSQIAYRFKLNPSGLGHQLRKYYPEILERRENERRRRGLNDNVHRGAKAWCREQYAEAVAHLHSTDDTIRDTARIFNLSYPGLREHLLFYHKELVEKRSVRRKNAKGSKIRGSLTGNGTRHMPSAQQDKTYEETARLYRDTAMTQKEIAEATGVKLSGLGNYLRMWRRDLIFERRGINVGNPENLKISETKRYQKSAAAKYAAAIERLKATRGRTAGVAREFGLNPDVFREYIREHEPQLAAELGMIRTSEGKLISAQSMEKYAEAIDIYETSTETLKSIAGRLGLKYNSIGGFIRRNRPDAIERHNLLVKKEAGTIRKKAEAEAAAKAGSHEREEKQRIVEALRLAGDNRLQAARLLGICKSSLYNKLKEFNITMPNQR